MGGEHLGWPLRLLGGAAGALLGLGALLVLEGPTHIVSHDYTQPSYVHHHHHLCHVLTMSLALAAWWWIALLALLARWPASRLEPWARRLFGLPVLLLSAVGAVTGWYVWATLETHDEVTYAGVMGVANGCVLIVVALHMWSLVQNPLREERMYAWNHLAVSLLFNAGLFCLFYFNNLPIASSLAGTSALLLLVGLYRAKLVLVREKIV